MYFDCVGCENTGGLGGGICLQPVFKALREKGNVEGLQFNKREYTEFYDKCHVEKLLEIAGLGRTLLGGNVWLGVRDCSRSHRDWRAFIRDLLMKWVWKDPVRAYTLLAAVLNQYDKPDVRSNFESKCLDTYLGILNDMKIKFEDTGLVRDHLRGLLACEIFKPTIQPSFVTSRVDPGIPSKADLVESYRVVDTDVMIYDLDGVDKIYFIKPPELSLSPGDVNLLMGLKDRVIEEHVLEIVHPLEARERFRMIGFELLSNTAGRRLDVSELGRLSEMFARYTAGYGLLEILFQDERIYDIYVDSPAGATPVYVDHEKFGVCTTNLYVTEDDMERISSKFRSIGGRPFDEANPVMDMELVDMGIRVTGIREPSTFDGIAYSFRKRREDPWTLPRFVGEGMMSVKSAALLGLIVSGQRSILITGARGSGKTSLLSALITEVKQNDRIVLMEDTPEIPVNSLRGFGWKIEHLRNQPAISRHNGESYELSPEENLRAALRLGEGVLILGEVRGPEARALFEAMRVGAAGNAVFGTIHGSNPYDTWDRITNDLNVPPASFKAVDVVVSLGYREDGEISKRNRYLRGITEVGKKWEKNPSTEDGFLDMMFYDDASGNERFNLENSGVMREISLRKGMSLGECNANLELRERMIKALVEASAGEGLKDLLEINSVLNANRAYVRLMNEQTLNRKSVDYRRLYRDWGKWFNGYVRDFRIVG